MKTKKIKKIVMFQNKCLKNCHSKHLKKFSKKKLTKKQSSNFNASAKKYSKCVNDCDQKGGKKRTKRKTRRKSFRRKKMKRKSLKGRALFQKRKANAAHFRKSFRGGAEPEPELELEPEPEKIVIFLLDAHSKSPVELTTKLVELGIKRLAFLQEHWRGKEGETPRKDQWFSWQENYKIPSDIDVKIFVCGAPETSGKYSAEQGDQLYQGFFKESMERNDNFRGYQAIIVNTGHSYPIVKAILDLKESGQLDPVIYDMQEHQAPNSSRALRQQKFKDKLKKFFFKD